ncbi:MAG: hypothetical protein JJT99_12705, partial [Rhodobacteraceae bacterium]|nr:hypothetical protein [Paracoccaceae bacterium]
ISLRQMKPIIRAPRLHLAPNTLTEGSGPEGPHPCPSRNAANCASLVECHYSLPLDAVSSLT